MGRETDAKIERLMRVAREAGVGGILLSTQRNFAWLTGGATNRIDGSRETGAGSLFITADGRRYVVANTIETPRLIDEALSGLAFEPVEYPWVEDHANPAMAVDMARVLTRSVTTIGADGSLPQATNLETAIMRVRAPLLDEEVERYRALGRDIGQVVADVCRALQPGTTEHDVAGLVSAAICRAGARPIVVLVAGDDRLARYRHPVATEAVWHRTLMVVVCAERHGLVVGLSRIVAVDAATPTLAERTAATARVFARLLEATREGTSGAQLYDAVARAYAEVGVAGEERRHHQGGAIGYRSRDWIAHPRSIERVVARQAFAWNPSITGTKVEDTALLIDGRLEIVTRSAGWPEISFEINRETLSAAGVLLLSA